MTERLVPRLGDQAKDIVTDVEGIVIAITHRLAACSIVVLQEENRTAPDGRAVPGRTYEFPIERVTVINAGWAVPSHLQVGV